MMKYLILLIICLGIGAGTWAQENNRFTWVTVGEDTMLNLQGKLSDVALRYNLDRLPAAAKEQVRKEVWNLSRNPSGVYLDFYTTADTIALVYRCDQNINLNHMNAIGVSGIDVYAEIKANEWRWVKPRYVSLKKDEVSVLLEGLDSTSLLRYRLYFPMYNTVSDFKIGLNKGAELSSKKSTVKPIVVYGTSITQGASASRAGLSWTALLGRRFDMPIINLGFSANGRLEKELIDVMVSQEASIYIIDCLPNLVAFTDDEVYERLLSAWQTLRKSHPQTPIIFTEHADATIDLLNGISKKEYDRVNRNLNKFITQNISGRDLNVHVVTAKSIGLGIDDTVDGVHPSDIGMLKYADAYTDVIRAVR